MTTESIGKLDWYLAYGYTRLGVVYSAQINSNEIIVKAEYTMNDYYDWNKMIQNLCLELLHNKNYGNYIMLVWQEILNKIQKLLRILNGQFNLQGEIYED